MLKGHPEPRQLRLKTNHWWVKPIMKQLFTLGFFDEFYGTLEFDIFAAWADEGMLVEDLTHEFWLSRDKVISILNDKIFWLIWEYRDTGLGYGLRRVFDKKIKTKLLRSSEVEDGQRWLEARRQARRRQL